ncbi:MAG: CDP-glycerol glycerophosphotransferase family protein [Candidatus Njordarchaeia archaeon]
MGFTNTVSKLGRYLFHLIYCLILSLLSYIVPKDRSLIVLGSHAGIELKDSPKYIYRFLTKCKKDLGFRIVYITDRVKGKKHKHMAPKRSSRAFLSLLRARAIIISHGLIDVAPCTFFGRFNVIQSWHGTPIKMVGYNSLIRRIRKEKGIIRKLISIRDLARYLTAPKLIVLSPSPPVSSLYKVVFREALRDIWEVGYPRNDIFFNDCLKNYDIVDKLNLKAPKKVILYAPTYRSRGETLRPFSDDFIKKIDLMLKKRNWILLVKKHPNTAKLDLIWTQNIVDISDMVRDIQELLPYVDVLITDYSSIMFDFLILGRPLILYLYDWETEWGKGAFFYNIFKCFPWPVVKKELELFDVILNLDSLRNPKTKIEKLNKLFNKEHDGTSILKLFKKIESNLI